MNNKHDISDCSSEITSPLSLTWKNSIETAIFHEGGNLKSELSDTSQPYYPIFGIQLARSDIHDNIILNTPVLGETTYPATALTYKYTLDRFMLDYLFLADYRDKNKEYTMSLSDDIHKQLIDFKNRSSKVKKDVIANLNAMKVCNHSEGDGYQKYRLLESAPAAFINLFNWYHVSGVHTTNASNPFALWGVRYQLSDAVKAPAFQLEDYIIHELISNVSLVLEITAILLEFKDKHLRNCAWDAFLHTPVEEDRHFRDVRDPEKREISLHFPTMCELVCNSPLLFTRISVARMFFRHILIEYELTQYKCVSPQDEKWFNKNFYDIISHALPYHIKLNNDFSEYNTYRPENPDEALSHLQSLLSEVTSPINFSEYIDKEPTHLAIFCNMKHTNMNRLMRYLEKAKLYPNVKTSKSIPVTLFNKLYRDIMKVQNANKKPE